jgi:hypothetical protein
LLFLLLLLLLLSLLLSALILLIMSLILLLYLHSINLQDCGSMIIRDLELSCEDNGSEDDIAAQVGVGSAAADSDLDSLKDAAEAQITAAGNLVGQFAGLVSLFCHTRCPRLTALAFPIMLATSSFCKSTSIKYKLKQHSLGLLSCDYLIILLLLLFSNYCCYYYYY